MNAWIYWQYNVKNLEKMFTKGVNCLTLPACPAWCQEKRKWSSWRLGTSALRCSEWPPPSCTRCTFTREDWMIYRGPGFLAAVVWLGSLLTLFPTLTSESFLSFSVFLWVTGRGRERSGGGGVKPYDREKAWPSTNHSILSDLHVCCVIRPRESLAVYKSFNTL
jgi:hypothetical protein